MKEYNHDRPHEALGQVPPGRLYQASPRSYPSKLPEVEYPAHYEVRKVSSIGMIRWRGAAIFTTRSLAGENIGLVEIEDGLWRMYFAGLELGVFDEVRLKDWRRRKVYAMCPV